MNPRKPLARRTHLRQGAPLKRSGWLRSGSSLQRSGSGLQSTAGSRQHRNGPVKARRMQWPGESAAERRARELVWARASIEHGYPLCEVCGLVPPTEYQHRKAKAHCSREEKWAPANGLAVCGHGNVSGCHGNIHQHPVEAEANGWTVKSHQDPLAKPVTRIGRRAWFDNEGGFSAEDPGARGAA